jgi:membrane fusion protein, heavy metal efflux system
MMHCLTITKPPFNLKYMQNKIIIYPFILLLFLSIACSQNRNEIKVTRGGDSNMICFSNVQNLKLEMETLPLQTQIFDNIIECQGSIVASPDDIVIVSLPIKGTIKELFVSPGTYISKGMLIATIENPELISMQEDYLIAKSQYDYYREDFKRQGELSLENATSLKIMQQAQNEFRKTEARMFSLKKRLQLIGIDPDSIFSENLHTKLEIKANASGFISQLRAVRGMFCTEEIPLCKITGDKNPILLLEMENKKPCIHNLNQTVEFFSLHDPQKIYHAKVTSVETESNEKGSYEVYAQILDKTAQIEVGNTVKAFIHAGEDTVLALPEEAIIKMKNSSYLIRKLKNNCFELYNITEGRHSNGMAEVLNSDSVIIQHEYVIKGTQEFYKKYFQTK